jgi:DNA-binding NarL/FixJ family response regulator
VNTLDGCEKIPVDLRVLCISIAATKAELCSAPLWRLRVRVVFSFDSHPPIRALVVDSSRIGSQLLGGALAAEQIHVVYSGANPQDAAAEVSRTHVDVALISTVLLGQPNKGYELAAQLRTMVPAPRTVMILDCSERESVVRAFRAGALGIFARDNSVDLLGKCVNCVYQGQVWATNSELRYLLEALTAPPQMHLVNANGAELLSPREQEVVHWVAEGLTNREIAHRLGLSENTIKNYMFRIFEKLGISKRVELVLYAASQLMPSALNGESDVSKAFENDAATVRWCREAAERFESHLYVLGEMFRDGRGVVASKPTALMWFFAAEEFAAWIVPQAREAERELQQQMPEHQIANARANLKEWLQKRITRKPSSENNRLREVG